MKTPINHDSLLTAGFEPCIFAPIYFSRYSYYIGNLDWSKGEVVENGEKKTLCNNLDWNEAKMILAISSDGESYIDWWSNKRFWTIEEIKEYCQIKGIEMVASKYIPA